MEYEDDSTTISTTEAAATATGSSMILDCAVEDENVALKKELIQLAASFDRGFGASPKARTQAEAVIRDLERCENAAQDAASTVLYNNNNNNEKQPTARPPHSLVGKWRMVWTTALDVLSLQASPFFTVGAIYQVFDSPSSTSSRVVTNVIDLLPRLQSLFPPDTVPNSLLRAKVATRACDPPNAASHPNRVGLVFESVAVQPQQILGVDGTALPPLAVDLPKLPDSITSSGYFDVTYLDAELLVIRQNAPGGLFALLRVDSMDP